MTKAALIAQILAKKSYLCIGLDTDLKKIPAHLLSASDPVFEFNKAVIEATADLCVAYKPNIAFYESLGPKGWESLQKTLEIIPDSHFTIADAKRGDIGNTSSRYAATFFEYFSFDSITVAPYMGEDSVKPFLEYKDKWVILLGLTSNPGSEDFQKQRLHNGMEVYEWVLRKAQEWATDEQLMFVVGATHPDKFEGIRKIIPDHFLLVPGVGAQGGDLETLSKHGLNKNIGLLVNSSREILYAGNGLDFAQHSRKVAQGFQAQMEKLLDTYA